MQGRRLYGAEILHQLRKDDAPRGLMILHQLRKDDAPRGRMILHQLRKDDAPRGLMTLAGGVFTLLLHFGAQILHARVSP